MKKFLKILFFVVVFLFIGMLTVPLIFKGDIMKLAKEEVNKNVKAQVDWDDISLSLFKGFPSLNVSLKNVSVLGIEDFEGDTLMAFNEFSVNVDLISAFSGEINVKSIILDNPVIRAIVLEDGSVNWDIAYPSDEEEPEVEETDTSSMDMKLSLKEFLITNASIHYYDLASGMEAVIDKFNFSLSGNFSEDYTDLSLQTSSDELSFIYDNIKYLNKADFGFKATLGADMVNSKFTVNENELSLNGLVLGVEGVFEIPDDSTYELDLRYFTRETSFKTLLSMIPAMYTSDFEGLTASGTLAIEGTAKGKVTDKVLPKVNLALKVKDGHFAYPDLPKSADNIQVDLNVFYDGVYDDNSKIDLNTFHVEMAGNPVDANFHVITPMSDMQMTGAVKGMVDLTSLADVVPVEDMDLQGLINMNLELMGKMSDIENENYEAFKADGLLEISNVLVSGGDVPVPVNVETMRMLFSPKYVHLEKFDLLMGKSDIHLSGRLENFIPYVFEDEIIRGELNFASSNLNINELMGESTEETVEETEDTSAMSVVEVPANISFVLQTKLDQVIYDQLEIENLRGLLTVKDGILRMDMLDMELLEGSMLMNGEYNTQDITTPMVDLDLSLSNIDIQSSFYAFNTVKQLAPVAESCRGKVSTQLKFTSFLDSTMSPVMNSIVGEGALQTEEVKIENNKALDKIGKLLKNEDLKNSKFKNIDLSFQIRNGRVYVDPFDTELGSAKVKIKGDQGLDKTLNYDLKFTIPRSEFGASANDALESLAAQAQEKGFELDPGEEVNVNFKVTGDFSDPKVSMDLKENMSNTKTQVKEAVKEKVTQEVEKVREEVKEDYNAEINRIMKDAEEKAADVRQAAKDAGVALIGEAELRRKQLIKEAGSNPLKKLAAEKSGDALVSKAKEKAKTLEKEADEKADNIILEAQKKADDLKK